MTSNTKILSGNKLKAMAAVFMLIDHIGLSLLPELLVLRIIGRIAFPIYSFLIVEGFFHTRSKKKYIAKITLLAVISEIPFDLLCSNTAFDISRQNVLWLFSAALISMYCIERLAKKQYGIILTVVLTIVSVCLRFDYGLCGVLTVAAFYLMKRRKCYWGLCAFVFAHLFLPSAAVSVFGVTLPIQTFALLALPLIYMYNSERGAKNIIMKYGFYIFYPAHLIVLEIIRVMFMGGNK